MKLWKILAATACLFMLVSCASSNDNSASTLSNTQQENLISVCRELQRQMNNTQNGYNPSDTAWQRRNTIVQLQRNYDDKGCDDAIS